MSRRHLLPAALLLPGLALALACGELGPDADAQADAEVAAERPEGWESLEDEGSASRLYYQFVDGRGRVRFVERIEEVPPQWRANVGFVKMAGAPPLSPGDAARARRSQRSSSGRQRVTLASAAGPEVILYSAEWCGACKKAKRHLSRKGVAFDERNVDVPSVANELVQKTGQRSIPVLDVGGRVYSGFNPGAYDDLVKGV